MGKAISSNVDDRTIHELYAWPFMDALRAGAGSVMCSYQRANDSYGCQNSKLMNGLLKTEFGLEGFIVSDWGAQHSGVASANAGLDVVMPNAAYWGSNLTTAVQNGSVALERLEDMVTRVLAAHYLLGQDDGFPDNAVYPYNVEHPITDAREDHAALIRQIGAAGHVLVKNVNGTLPLKAPRFLNIFGYDAEVKASPWNNPSRYGGGTYSLLSPDIIKSDTPRLRRELRLEHPERNNDHGWWVWRQYTALRNKPIQSYPRSHHCGSWDTALGFLGSYANSLCQRRCLPRIHQRICI